MYMHIKLPQDQEKIHKDNQTENKSHCQTLYPASFIKSCPYKYILYTLHSFTKSNHAFQHVNANTVHFYALSARKTLIGQRT